MYIIAKIRYDWYRMPKTKSTTYICQSCGGEHFSWQGRCQFCGEWNTLKEFKESFGNSFASSNIGEIQTPSDLFEIQIMSDIRIETSISEFDRVLGGGIINGSIILIGGDPGIGKSTLLLQAASNLADKYSPEKIIYISGEESLSQIKNRATRLNLNNSHLNLLNETNLPNIIETLTYQKPKVVIIDSIQTIYEPSFPSTPGSLVQVRECALRLQQFSKKENIAIILVGHITKDGNVAGPKILEHLVDAVLYLEGERYHNIRILRGIKNRFGSISESGLFEMTEKGFIEILNPSQIFLSEKIHSSGSVVSATIEGRRPFLIEVQALVKKTIFGYPKRTSSGYDLNRLQLLLAVIEKKAGIDLNNYDIYINIVGGLKIKEPAIDLAIICAIVSTNKDITIDDKLVIWGEIGLSGEIRRVLLEKERINETTKLGYHYFEKTNTIYEFLKRLNLL